MRRLCGPPIDPYRAGEDTSKAACLRGPLDGNGRRSIYIKMTLMEPPRFLALFNQPIPKLTFGHRDVTNVPDQALALLNDPLVHRPGPDVERASRRGRGGSGIRASAGDVLAARCPASDKRREPAARRAGPRSRPACGSAGRRTDAIGPAAVWQDVAHAIFNLKEFIYVP